MFFSSTKLATHFLDKGELHEIKLNERSCCRNNVASTKINLKGTAPNNKKPCNLPR